MQIGGVLEPIGQSPVIIEDDVFVGAGAVVVEGVLVGARAVIAPGVVLSKSAYVYDCVKERVLEMDEPIPCDAVVVPGARPLTKAWAKQAQLSAQCALIIKYRDKQTDERLGLEDILRTT